MKKKSYWLSISVFVLILIWTACTKRRRKALKLLGFWDAQKRIYAKLTPLTPKIQAHDRVMKTDTHICGCRSFCTCRYDLETLPRLRREMRSISQSAYSPRDGGFEGILSNSL